MPTRIFNQLFAVAIALSMVGTPLGTAFAARIAPVKAVGGMKTGMPIGALGLSQNRGLALPSSSSKAPSLRTVMTPNLSFGLPHNSAAPAAHALSPQAVSATGLPVIAAEAAPVKTANAVQPGVMGSLTRSVGEIKKTARGGVRAAIGTLSALFDGLRHSDGAPDGKTAAFDGAGAVTEANIPGWYIGRTDFQGPMPVYFEFQIRGDHNYSFRWGSPTAPEFQGTWELRDGTFQGVHMIPGMGEVTIEIPMSELTNDQLKSRDGASVIVRTSLIDAPLPVRLRKMSEGDTKGIDEVFQSLKDGLDSENPAQQIRSGTGLALLATADRSEGGPARREEMLRVIDSWAARRDGEIPAEDRRGFRGMLKKQYRRYEQDPGPETQGFLVPFNFAIYQIFTPMRMLRGGDIDAIKGTLDDSLDEIGTISAALGAAGSEMAGTLADFGARLRTIFDLFRRRTSDREEFLSAVSWLAYYLLEELPWDQDRRAVLKAADRKLKQIENPDEETRN